MIMLIDANNLDDNDDANHDNDTIKITPVVQVWSWSVQRYGGKRLLGTREIIGEEDEVQPNGQVFK